MASTLTSSGAIPAARRAVDQLLRASRDRFAVVWCGNHQYKVSVGDVIVVQRLRAEIGSEIFLKKVLMLGGPQFTAIGRPLLERVEVRAAVEEQKRMRNVVSLYSTPGRRRTRWVDQAHAATVLRITDIQYAPEVLGEVDKYEGQLLPEEQFNPQEGPNPVYTASSGYDIYEKRSTDGVESAVAMDNQPALSFMEELALGSLQTKTK